MQYVQYFYRLTGRFVTIDMCHNQSARVNRQALG